MLNGPNIPLVVQYSSCDCADGAVLTHSAANSDAKIPDFFMSSSPSLWLFASLHSAGACHTSGSVFDQGLNAAPVIFRRVSPPTQPILLFESMVHCYSMYVKIHLANNLACTE